MSQRILKLNVLLIAATVTGGLWYFLFGNIDFIRELFSVNALLFKGIAASFFVILGIVNLIFALKSKLNGKAYPILMAVSLAISMSGDIGIGFNFVLGAALFAASHILYITAYCKISSFEIKDLWFSLAVFVPSAAFLLLFPRFEFGSGILQAVCVIYALIISCMVGKGIANFVKNKNSLTLTVLIGCILFFISDLALVIGQFSDLTLEVTFLEIPMMSFICLMTYFPAQCALAHSIYRYAVKSNNS